MCNFYFERFPCELKGTSRNVAGFNRYHHISFDIEVPGLDDVLFLGEYAYSFVLACRVLIQRDLYADKRIVEYVERHLNQLCQRVHHQAIRNGAFVKLVPENVVVGEVAGRLQNPLSVKTFMYNHRSMRGNMDQKKEILKALGDQLEPRRAELKLFNDDLENCIFTDINAMNIRHNNVEKGKPKYKPFFAEKSLNEQEQWYDHVYQMMLIAFLVLENYDGIIQNKAVLAKINAS